MKEEINIGNLSKRIGIYEPIIKEGRLGEDKTILRLKAERWAEITPLKNKEEVVNYHQQSDLKYKIVIRHYEDLNFKWYLSYQGRVFNITSIVDIGMRHNFDEILCTEYLDCEYEFEEENNGGSN